MTQINLHELYTKLSNHLVRVDFSGTDPFFSWTQNLARWPAMFKFADQANRQIKRLSRIHKFSLGSRQHIKMVKTQGLFLAAQFLSETAPKNIVQTVRNEVLSSQLIDGGWGYEFNVSVRWGSYGPLQGNAIATHFALKGVSAHLSASNLNNAKLFLSNRLFNGKFFTYYEGSTVLIHNANVLAALSLAQLGGDRDQISSALQSTLNCQRPDGSWPYGEGKNLSWVDNFHTAYVLWGLSQLASMGFDNLASNLDLGIGFWLENMFEAGKAKQTQSKQASFDAHTCATAIYVILDLYEAGFCNSQSFRLVESLLEELSNWLEAKAFPSIHSASPMFAGHTRWELGHAALALSTKLATTKRPDDEEG